MVSQESKLLLEQVDLLLERKEFSNALKMSFTKNMNATFFDIV